VRRACGASAGCAAPAGVAAAAGWLDTAEADGWADEGDLLAPLDASAGAGFAVWVWVWVWVSAWVWVERAGFLGVVPAWLVLGATSARDSVGEVVGVVAGVGSVVVGGVTAVVLTLSPPWPPLPVLPLLPVTGFLPMAAVASSPSSPSSPLSSLPGCTPAPPVEPADPAPVPSFGPPDRGAAPLSCP